MLHKPVITLLVITPVLCLSLALDVFALEQFPAPPYHSRIKRDYIGATRSTESVSLEISAAGRCGDIKNCANKACEERVLTCQHLKPDHFTVPKAYLVFKDTWGGGMAIVFQVECRLSEHEGLDSDKSGRTEWSRDHEENRYRCVLSRFLAGRERQAAR